MARSSPLLIALLAVGCQTFGPSGPPSIAPYELRERIREIEIGDPAPEVRARLGTLPVRRPGHPGAPFPTPYREASLRSPAGDRVEVEVYVVATRPAEGCPDVQYDDVPVAYRNGRVVALSWDEIEWRWREWGGGLSDLRRLQDRFVCEPEPAADPAAGPPGPPDPPAAAGSAPPSPGALDTSASPTYISAPSRGC